MHGYVSIYLTSILWIFTTDLILDCSTATNVEIELPVPPDATNPNVRTSMGSASYAPEKDSLVWKIKSFPGGKVGIYLGHLKFLWFFPLLYTILDSSCMCNIPYLIICLLFCLFSGIYAESRV